MIAGAKDAHTRVELISETTSIEPGKPFWVALRLAPEKGWHTYWKNPGDSGLATKIDWILPKGFEAGPILWPTPEIFKTPPIVSFGYSKDVLLLTEIKTPSTLKEGALELIQAKVGWLACKVICIPGKADLSIKIPVASKTPEINKPWGKDFIRAREDLPQTAKDWQIKAKEEKDDLVLQLKAPKRKDVSLSKVYFFPNNASLIDHLAEQKLTKTKEGYELTLKKSNFYPQDLKSVKGVLTSKEGWGAKVGSKGLEVDAAIKAEKGSFFQTGFSMGLALIFAFLGGVALNLMPCVFPVLSIKVLNFLEHRKKNKGYAFGQAIVYSFGILISFWILAGLLIALKAAGNVVGWGYQLQSPFFLISLSIIFFIFALSLFGVFEIGVSLTRLGSVPQKFRGTAGSFFSGVLAVIVATPCTAPFMGSALGFALTQPVFNSLLIFTFLGLGLAAPYLLLAAFPVLTKFVPKPGPWMVRFKQILGFPLMATVLWLLWVLGQQRGTDAVISVFLGLLIIGLGFWILGTFYQTARKKLSRLVSFILILLCFAAGLWLTFFNVKETTPLPSQAEKPQKEGIPWIPYSELTLANSLKEGKPVFLDFTAAWCLTCQVNEKIALRSSRVIQKFKEMNIVSLKADLTNPNPKLTQALEKYDRASVPLYVFYPKGKPKEPVILPELITPEIILKVLEDKK